MCKLEGRADLPAKFRMAGELEWRAGTPALLALSLESVRFALSRCVVEGTRLTAGLRPRLASF
jgi:hypothetical protein